MKKILKNIPLILLLGLVLSRLILVSCTKEKVLIPISTTPVVDPNCPDTIHFFSTNTALTTISTIMNDNCVVCHDNGGTPPDLSAYTSIKDNASAILNSMQPGAANPMPQGGDPMPDSLIKKFNCWISQGKLNN